jgi:hypothetical protein
VFTVRLFRAKFTVRRLMIVVAISAISIFAVMTWQRRSHYQWVASEFARREKSSRAILISYPGSASIYRANDVVTGAETGFFDTRNANYYARMREKYERPAQRPWILIGPDPFESN